jgi:50S ribosomal subunit-associated GTPase HflX
MKKILLLLGVCWFANSVNAQNKWDKLTDEQKIMKLKSFRAENQKYQKDSLKLSATQMADLDNVNLCFLSTLDRIDRYAKDEATKSKYGDALWEVRWAQVDAIIGKEKHKQYASYIQKKIDTALK